MIENKLIPIPSKGENMRFIYLPGYVFTCQGYEELLAYYRENNIFPIAATDRNVIE